MKRIKVLFGNRRMMVLLTLAILVLAAAAIIASSASFTAKSTNVSNNFAAGNLTMTTNSFSFSALGGKLMPGESTTGTASITVTSDGGPSTLYLHRTALTNADGLAGKLDVVVNDGTADVFTGTLDDGTLGNGVVVATVPDSAAGTTYTYTFTVTFHDGDDHSLAAAGADNAYRNTSATANFEFQAVSN
jgi:hypothetical protein